jgi:hypothetical protein
VNLTLIYHHQVQPYKDMLRLEEMMASMQAEYKQQKYPHPPLDSVYEGELYAALHNDGHWYRYVATFNLHIMAHGNT